MWTCPREYSLGAGGLFEKGWKFTQTAKIFRPTGAALYLARLATDEIVVAGAKWAGKTGAIWPPIGGATPKPPVQTRLLGFTPSSQVDLGPFVTPAAERWLFLLPNPVPSMLLSIGGLYP